MSEELKSKFEEKPIKTRVIIYHVITVFCSVNMFLSVVTESPEWLNQLEPILQRIICAAVTLMSTANIIYAMVVYNKYLKQ